MIKVFYKMITQLRKVLMVENNRSRHREAQITVVDVNIKNYLFQ